MWREALANFIAVKINVIPLSDSEKENLNKKKKYSQVLGQVCNIFQTAFFFSLLTWRMIISCYLWDMSHHKIKRQP